MEQSATLVQGHYQIKLPFRSDSAATNGNYFMAKQRLLFLKRRFEKDFELKQKYEEVIHRYESEGACSKVIQGSKEGRWFLPLQAVSSQSSIRLRCKIQRNFSQ